MKRLIQKLLGWTVLMLAWHALAPQMVARPRPAMPPYPESVLMSWRFDDTNLLSWGASSGFQHNLLLVEGWSGYALSMEGKSARLFAVPTVAENGKTNLSASVGTIRFWFRPSWSSSSVDGKGPKQGGRLLEVGAWGRNSAVAWWSMQFDNTGDTLALMAQSGGECASILSVPIQWAAGEWHQIALSYSPAGSWLFLDGQMVAQGQAVALVPLDNTPGTPGFCVGSDVRGAHLAQGQFDELTTFGSVQRTDLVGWNFSCLAGTAALGPITPQEDAARLARFAATRSAQTMSSQAMMYAMDGPPAITNGNGTGSSIITNLPPAYSAEGLKLTVLTTNGSNATMTVFDGIGGVWYDVFRCTNLLGRYMTNSTWTWLGQVTNSQTFTLANQPWPNSFFILGTPEDSDGDGVPDAFEALVHGHLWDLNPNEDLDGDGTMNCRDARPFDSRIHLMEMFVDDPISGSTLY